MNKICQNCRYGASVRHIGECGCPGIEISDVAEYMQLLGFKNNLFAFLSDMSMRTGVALEKSFSVNCKNIARAVMPKSAAAIGCDKYKPRIVAGRDLWELWKGGDR